MASKLSLCNSVNKLTNFPIRSSSSSSSSNTLNPIRSLKTVGSLKFTWDDVIRISQSHTALPLDDDNSCYLQPFFQRIKTCNRGADKKSDFFPFVVDEQIVGYVHKEFSEHLRKFKDVFTFGQDTSHLFGRIEYHGVYVALHPSLNSPDDRTEAVEDVIKSLGESLIPGIRNELYPVKSAYGMPVCFSLERAAAPYFGIKARICNFLVSFQLWRPAVSTIKIT